VPSKKIRLRMLTNEIATEKMALDEAETQVRRSKERIKQLEMMKKEIEHPEKVEL